VTACTAHAYTRVKHSHCTIHSRPLVCGQGGQGRFAAAHRQDLHPARLLQAARRDAARAAPLPRRPKAPRVEARTARQVAEGDKGHVRVLQPRPARHGVQQYLRSSKGWGARGSAGGQRKRRTAATHRPPQLVSKQEDARRCQKVLDRRQEALCAQALSWKYCYGPDRHQSARR